MVWGYDRFPQGLLVAKAARSFPPCRRVRDKGVAPGTRLLEFWFERNRHHGDCDD